MGKLQEDYWAQVRRQGYQQALNDMLQRLDRLMENSEDMDWHRGVLAARHELCHLPIPPASPEEG